MPTMYPINSTTFDGGKFAARYGIDSLKGDFWASVVNGQMTLFIKDGIALPDNPPIFEPPDAPEVITRRFAISAIDFTDGNGKLLRAIAAVLVDELNLHADKINSILTAVDNAATLAALKTAVALITDYPQRTLAQTVTAIKNKINTGTVD